MEGEQGVIHIDNHLPPLLYKLVRLKHKFRVLLLITAQALHYQKFAFNQLKNYQLGRNHLSVPVVVKGNRARSYCKYKKCPSLKSA